MGEPRLLHADKGAEEKGHHVQSGIGDHHPDGAEERQQHHGNRRREKVRHPRRQVIDRNGRAFMLRLQRREHGRQRHEGGDKDPKAMAKVLRNVVKRQAGERHPDAAEPAHHLHPAQFFPEDPPQHVRENGGEEEDCPYLEPF